MANELGALDRLLTRRAQLDAQIADAQARARRSQKKADDREKILLGAWLVQRLNVDKDRELAIRLAAELPEFLVRERDREFMRARGRISGNADEENEQENYDHRA